MKSMKLDAELWQGSGHHPCDATYAFLIDRG